MKEIDEFVKILYLMEKKEGKFKFEEVRALLIALKKSDPNSQTFDTSVEITLFITLL